MDRDPVDVPVIKSMKSSDVKDKEPFFIAGGGEIKRVT